MRDNRQLLNKALETKHRLNVIEDEIMKLIKPYNIRLSDFYMMYAIYLVDDKMSMSDVSDEAGIHVSTVFNFSKRLEEKGLLEIYISKSDRRKRYIKLTRTGKKIINDILGGVDL